MEVKRCIRCGNFVMSGDDLCINCSNKDKLEIQKLKNYFEDNENTYTIGELSANRGISEENLTRYMGNQEFASYLNPDTSNFNQMGNF